MSDIDEKKEQKKRNLIIYGLFGSVVLFYAIVLIISQGFRGSEFLAQSIASNAQSEVVEASRGIITDRNGTVLVSNKVTYTLTMDSSYYDDNNSKLNEAILSLIHLFTKYGVEWDDTLPISYSEPYIFESNYRSDEDLSDFMDTSEFFPDVTDAEHFLNQLYSFFEIDDKLSETVKRQVAGIRYELECHSSYIIAEDIPVEMISELADSRIAGITTNASCARVYNTDYAAHVLGRISRIYAEDWEEYQDLGYSMDSLVGISGVEKAFESYLAGHDGIRLITTDNSGNITGELYTVDPSPGATVALTIDIGLQQVAEESLAATIEEMDDENSEIRGGAAVVIEVGTGEVLALASYPTYQLTSYNEDYSSLLEDPRLPLFNRATDGTYAPGSTFKMVTAVAALENDIITPETYIYDQCIYTYYEDPQPMCWLWRTEKQSHGYVNVSDALEVSCNYFFYEVGRLTGQDTINNYAAQFGLGLNTGIEIGDAQGSVASKEFAESHDLEWSEGQTLTAAIGQSYNLFSPIQLANYTATLAGNGEHYDAHLLKSVKSYDNTSIIYLPSEEPTNTVSFSSETENAVLKGMYGLTTGSLSSAFDECIVSAGAKTGSAQVGTDIANGVMVAFAPYDDPEIAVAIVIEKGGAGAALASTVVEIINAYFSGLEEEDSLLSEHTLVK